MKQEKVKEIENRLKELEGGVVWRKCLICHLFHDRHIPQPDGCCGVYPPDCKGPFEPYWRREA